MSPTNEKTGENLKLKTTIQSKLEREEGNRRRRRNICKYRTSTFVVAEREREKERRKEEAKLKVIDINFCVLFLLWICGPNSRKRTFADVKIEDILSVNHGLRKEKIQEGQTILLPSSKLSERDREILDGVKGWGKYRAYPVRKGECIEDIIEKRGITMDEVEALNEGVDLSSLRGK